MKQFFNEFLYSNIVVSLSASSLYIYYTLLTESNFPIIFPFLVFSGTFLCYHLQRLGFAYFNNVQGDELNHFYNKWKYPLAFTLICAVAICIYSLYFLNNIELLAIILSAVLCILYIKAPWLKFGLRSIPFAKPFIIALVWTLVCCVPVENTDWKNYIECFIFIIILSIPFDIKDKIEDHDLGIKTFATENEKGLTNALIIIGIFHSLYIGYYESPFFSIIFISFFSWIILGKRKTWKYFLGLDGLIILRFLLYL